MARHSLIKIQSLEETGKRRSFSDTPPNLSHKNLKWVPILAGVRETADPATQKIVTQTTVTIDAVTEDRVAVPLSQAELDYIAEDRNNRISSALASLDKLFVEGIEDNLESSKLKAIVEAFARRDNYLVKRIIELQEDLLAVKATSGGGDNIRGAIRVSYLPTSTKNKASTLTDIRADLAAGNQN